jgi:antitoxin component YwqK of YwqJK toxin-antitoxin module
LKAIILPRYILIFFAFALLSFGDPYTIKRVSDKNFRYEFYTTDKKITPNKNQTYYWFKGGLIHESQGGIAGNLLNDTFIKMYHNNQLAEQGTFKNGLRVGIWKTWYTNGALATSQKWKNGLRSGKFSSFDTNGVLIESGNFISNAKTGKWINTENRDTLIYKKGLVVLENPTLNKSEKYRLKQENIKLENAKKEQQEATDAEDAAKLAAYKAQAKEEKKIKDESRKPSKLDIFYKTLFKKKDKAPK